MAVALAAVDVMAAADVTDMVDADLTAVADVEAVAMTVVDVVTAYQAQPLSALGPSLDQDAVDRVKPNIVHCHVTGDRIFVDDNT